MSVFTLRRPTGGSSLRDVDALRVSELSGVGSVSAAISSTATGQALRQGAAAITVTLELAASRHTGEPFLTVTSVVSANGLQLVSTGSLAALPSLISIGGRQ